MLNITNTRQYLLQAALHYQYTTVPVTCSSGMVNETNCSTLPIHDSTCYRQLWDGERPSAQHYQYMTLPVTCRSPLPIHDSTCYRQLSITNTRQYLLQATLHYQYTTVPVTGNSVMVNETKCSTLPIHNYLLQAALHYQYTSVPVTGSSPLPIHDSTCYRQLSITNT